MTGMGTPGPSTTFSHVRRRQARVEPLHGLQFQIPNSNKTAQGKTMINFQEMTSAGDRSFALQGRGGGAPPVLVGVQASGRLEGVLLTLCLRQTYRNAGSGNVEVVYTEMAAALRNHGLAFGAAIGSVGRGPAFGARPDARSAWSATNFRFTRTLPAHPARHRRKNFQTPGTRPSDQRAAGTAGVDGRPSGVGHRAGRVERASQ